MEGVDDLAPLCGRVGRWSLPYVIAPLRLPAGTRSLVSAVAMVWRLRLVRSR